MSLTDLTNVDYELNALLTRIKVSRVGPGGTAAVECDLAPTDVNEERLGQLFKVKCSLKLFLN